MMTMLFTKQRLEERTAVAVEASMRFAGEEHPVTLLNASSHGVLARCACPPVRGTVVMVSVAGHQLGGQVRWRGADRCGIALRDEIEVDKLLRGQLVPVTFIPVDHLDSYRGPEGIVRAITSDGPVAARISNAVLLIVAVACVAFVFGRLGAYLAA